METTVQKAISEFYLQNNFGEDGGVSKNVAWIKIGFFSVPIPNTESRKKNVILHDIGHLITGNATNWKGESSVSAWEIASGGWGKNYFLWILTLWAMGLGVVFYTKSIVQSFKKGLTMRNAFSIGIPLEIMLKMPIEDLKNKLSGNQIRSKNIRFWMLFAFLIFALPFFIGIILLLLLINTN